MRRDRKGRFSLGPKSPEALAEKALLRQVRDVLSALGSDLSAGGASLEHGILITLKSQHGGLKDLIGSAVRTLVAGRAVSVEVQHGHAGCVRYTVRILPAATPRAAHVGGPLASAEVSA